jgi:hypothetical protein
MTRVVCAARFTRRNGSPGGTGIVDKTGGYVGPAATAGPAKSDKTLMSHTGDVLLERQQGGARVVVEWPAQAGQFERS